MPVIHGLPPRLCTRRTSVPTLWPASCGRFTGRGRHGVRRMHRWTHRHASRRGGGHVACIGRLACALPNETGSDCAYVCTCVHSLHALCVPDKRHHYDRLCVLGGGGRCTASARASPTAALHSLKTRCHRPLEFLKLHLTRTASVRAQPECPLLTTHLM